MSALEEVTEFVQGGQQGVDIVPIVVAGQGGTHRAADTERFHQRHGAVMADPQGYTLHVEQGGGILRVDVVEQETVLRASSAVLAADGFETIECLTMVDVMRRGGVRATLVSIMPTREVVSSLQIPVTCDALFDEINFDEYDCVVLPGGLPGATNLRADQRVCDVVCEFAATKHVAAICAAPFILGELDLLEGRHATCFPGFEKSFPEGAYTGEKVTQDGNIITASGMAQSLPFALELLRTLAGDKAVEKVAEGIQL